MWFKIFSSKKHPYVNSSKKIINKKKIEDHLLQVVYKSNKSFVKNFKKLLVQNLKINLNDSVLDFGSGNGAVLLYLLKKYKIKKSISLEINKDLIKFQKKVFGNKIDVKKNNFQNLKIIKKQKFDHVISNSVFQYFKTKKEAIKYFNYLKSICKRNLLITDLYYKPKKKEMYNWRKSRVTKKLLFSSKIESNQYLYYEKKDFKVNKRRFKITFLKGIKIHKMEPKKFCIKVERIV